MPGECKSPVYTCFTTAPMNSIDSGEGDIVLALSYNYNDEEISMNQQTHKESALKTDLRLRKKLGENYNKFTRAMRKLAQPSKQIPNNR